MEESKGKERPSFWRPSAPPTSLSLDMPSALHHRIAFTSRLINKKKKHKKKNKKKKGNNNNNNNSNTPTHYEDKEEEEEEELLEEEEVGSFKLKPSDPDDDGGIDGAHLIQPLGNLLLLPDPSAAAAVRARGLGSLAALPDSLLLDSLLPLLPAPDLARLSTASKPLFILATHDPLWRPLLLRHLAGHFSFTSSWRSTYISNLHPTHHRHRPPLSASRLRLPVFYSDHLFQSCLCARLQMKPDWLLRDNIPRCRAISLDDFVRRFEEPNRPVLLQGCLDAWPAIAHWDRPALLRLCGDTSFSAGPVDMTLPAYFRYSDAAREERPLYLFDPKFADKVPQLGRDYEPPVYFREDLFGLLGDERPDYRWIIIGPAGSGSSFHVDPNSTSAWNAVVRGSKKWVMFPPEVVPPGVHPSPDGAEVACPVSIMEWFMNFYDECRKWKRRPVECVCRAGEVVFVPNGWWHLVINLEDSIAITQNYVSRRNLLNVLDFLKKPNASELVSGTEDRVNLYEKFSSAVEVAFPGTIDELRLRAQEKMAQEKKPTFWESVSDANTGGFKFAF